MQRNITERPLAVPALAEHDFARLGPATARGIVGWCAEREDAALAAAPAARSA